MPSDAQWARMEPLVRQAVRSRPQRHRTTAFARPVWIARTGSPGESAAQVRPLEQRVQALPRRGEARFLGRGCSSGRRRARHGIRTADATRVKVHRHGRAQKRDSKPGSAVERRQDHQNPGAHDALGNLVRVVRLPGQRFDTVGVPPLIRGIDFDALIADKTFDINAIIADLDAARRKVVISQHPRRAKPLAIDERDVQRRRSAREFLRQTQGVQANRMRDDKTDQSFAATFQRAAAAKNCR